ncbi:hypothetical protein BV898_06611 [Hypsibius exemplaris]|uniref:Secreted protein n=1 Tax=Hypsibius exemplaris TaxID=2072580 RepID=A0A1W0WVZ6_HYPEX|nr:hypothetical protein BV898_06611 [Hypsibius exemplaris]
MTTPSWSHFYAAAVILLVAQVVQGWTPDVKDDCYILCGLSPNSVKCFRCKNRLPMRFGKRGNIMGSGTMMLGAHLPANGAGGSVAGGSGAGDYYSGLDFDAVPDSDYPAGTTTDRLSVPTVWVEDFGGPDRPIVV